MAEIRINATGGVKLYDADDSHYAQIVAGTITSNVDALTLGHASADFNIPVKVLGTTPTLTVGDAGAEDTKIVFDGNAQDFYIGLDDSADDLLIGLGSTVGTTPAIAIDENLKVNIPVTTASTSASTGSLTTGGGAGIGADLYVGDDAYLITDSAVLGFGADKDTTLTHTDGTGLTLNSTNKLTFGDAASFIQQSSDGVLRIDGEATVDINASAAITLAATNVPVTVGGIPFYNDGNSIYTHNVSGTDDSADDNTSFGITALDAITTGDRNTALGYKAGTALNSGANNVILGQGAAKAQTTGDNNTVCGYEALNVNVGGHNNVAIGSEAGQANTASANVFLGTSAGKSNSSGARIIAIGHDSYTASDTESDNVAIGFNAMTTNTAGGEANVIIGNYAGDAITSGDDNAACGHQAGSQITTGSKNTCMGKGAGGSLATGDENVCLGRESAPAATDSDNSVTLGSSQISSLRCQVQSISALSDERDKTDIINLPYGLDFINSTRPVQYKWNIRDKYRLENNPHQGKTRNGFIAQELLALGNNDQHSLVLEDNPDRLEAANAALMPMMVKAVQELSAKVVELEKKLEDK